MDIPAIYTAFQSHAMAAGLFETVNTHEPKNTPGKGLHAAVWSDWIGPTQTSGLAATTARIIFKVRIYSDMLQEPQDMIDPNILGAVHVLMAAYSADFTLGGLVRNVDLLGQYGEGLSAQAGYVSISGQMHRVMTITAPVIVSDAWPQAA